MRGSRALERGKDILGRHRACVNVKGGENQQGIEDTPGLQYGKSYGREGGLKGRRRADKQRLCLLQCP